MLRQTAVLLDGLVRCLLADLADWSLSLLFPAFHFHLYPCPTLFLYSVFFCLRRKCSITATILDLKISLIRAFRREFSCLDCFLFFRLPPLGS
ncbi:hypothetical protein BD289DRAFT_183505 [Coniella lustricola]|uniref:Uncharacterized protein n=1 Tax=Coniella lustricola TaxID=2025994 RepID=A0A2T3ADB1_9PEZI|nr:hypothetical protein BD289DRAFT_183505 [Coniella lustricola]